MNHDDQDPRETGQPPRSAEHDPSPSQHSRLTRRRFLATGATTSALAGLQIIADTANAQDATPPASNMADMPGMSGATPAAGEDTNPATDGFVHFSPPDAAVIAAAAARLIPTDDNGPGATEAGVVYFIDRQLAKEHFGYTGPVYRQGPFLQGEPTQGDQSALSNANRFRLGIGGMNAYAQQLYEKRFVDLSEDQQDRILSDMEQGKPDTFDGASIQAFPPVYTGSGTEEIQLPGQAGVGADAFFTLLLEYVLAGFFADPVHGGNRDMVGWKLIGFPGAQGFVYDKWILRYGEEFTGDYKSLSDYQQQLDGGS